MLGDPVDEGRAAEAEDDVTEAEAEAQAEAEAEAEAQSAEEADAEAEAETTEVAETQALEELPVTHKPPPRVELAADEAEADSVALGEAETYEAEIVSVALGAAETYEAEREAEMDGAPVEDGKAEVLVQSSTSSTSSKTHCWLVLWPKHCQSCKLLPTSPLPSVKSIHMF